MIVPRKRNLQRQHDTVHHQSEHHADEHAKGLKQWFLKDFESGFSGVFIVGAVGPVKAHHGLGTDAASRSEEDGEEEEDYFEEAAFVDVGQVGHDLYIIYFRDDFVCRRERV
mmetsp:Transcript_28495/g.60129  ORF Transcript_28495/g.60129 Transcript_28495/m.60129 type:complete len:112 (+) Transcript_28495:1325-1660(+)